MLQRVLAVSFAQVLRTVAILLLPLAFISLIAWATAGSATGNTSDPMRAAIWLWLGAHHIPFFLNGTATGYLSYLPIGAMLLPFFVLRTGFGRALSKLHGDFHNVASVRSIFASHRDAACLGEPISHCEFSVVFSTGLFLFYRLSSITNRRITFAYVSSSQLCHASIGDSFRFLIYLLGLRNIHKYLNF
jgi:hypothetical protein